MPVRNSRQKAYVMRSVSGGDFPVWKVTEWGQGGGGCGVGVGRGGVVVVGVGGGCLVILTRACFISLTRESSCFLSVSDAERPRGPIEQSEWDNSRREYGSGLNLWWNSSSCDLQNCPQRSPRYASSPIWWNQTGIFSSTAPTNTCQFPMLSSTKTCSVLTRQTC